MNSGRGERTTKPERSDAQRKPHRGASWVCHFSDGEG